MGANIEPGSWGELLHSYRDTWGSRSYISAVGDTQQIRYTRSVPDVCPLAEVKHPLYATGGKGTHSINPADGSLQRSQWHGWGDTSLLKQEGYEGQPHPRGEAQHAAGRRWVLPPSTDGCRAGGLFGLLQGTGGAPDAWLGNPQIDPTKGKRAIAAPSDPKRTAGMAQLLAQTAPASPATDAWLGHISIDPAKGKGRAADSAALRGRAGLFEIMQQTVLQQQQQNEGGGYSSQHGDGSSGGGIGGNRTARHHPADEDAWMGNKLIQPNKGKKAVQESPAAADSLHGATFAGPPPPDACWSDLPPIGRRPLPPPSTARCFVTAAQAMAMEVPLPPTAVLGLGKAQGKRITHGPQLPHHTSSMPGGGSSSSSNSSNSSGPVSVYSLMTYRPLSTDEQQRWQQAWSDAARQPRKRPVPSAVAAHGAGLQALLAAPAAHPVRRVPCAGGIAQEVGMSLDTIIANRRHCQRGSSAAPAKGPRTGGNVGGGAGGGSGSR